MDVGLGASSVTKVSMAIYLIDSYSGNPPIGPDIEVFINYSNGAKPKMAIRNLSNFFVMTDLPAGSYCIHIKSSLYLDAMVEVDTASLKPLNPVVNVSLLPIPAYPFDQNATLIRALLQDASGNLVSAPIQANVLSDQCAIGRLVGDGNGKGTTEISLTGITGKIVVGDQFMMKGKTAKEGEICQIAAINFIARTYTLLEPLQRQHSRGDLLLPIVNAKSTDAGEVVIPFRSNCVGSFDIKLEISGSNEKSFKEVSATQGSSSYAGIIQL